eukprot:1016062-Karenia_brevis.AAC.1
MYLFSDSAGADLTEDQLKDFIAEARTIASAMGVKTVLTELTEGDAGEPPAGGVGKGSPGGGL